MPTASEIVRVLAPCINASRLARMQTALRFRVADTALVFENIVDAHNISACLRTADALGIQFVHVIERWNDAFSSFRTVDKGTGQWLTLKRWKHAVDCVHELKQDGFRIFATDLGGSAMDITTAIHHSLHLDSPSGSSFRPRIAIVLGNEHRGCSRALLERADSRIFIPQLGFVQSMNLSVATSIIAHAFMHRTPDYQQRCLAAFDAMHGQSRGAGTVLPMECASAGSLKCEPLSDTVQWAILANWLLCSVANADRILDRAGARPHDL
jgi:tRNA (guanosine-2'-O-)-methyltransferase